MTNLVTCTLRIQSNNIESVHQTIELLAKNAHGLEVKGASSLPMKKKVFTVLRSPHIDKKSREQFEIRTYAKSVSILNIDDSKLNELLNWLKDSLSYDVSIKVKFTSFEKLH